MLYGVHFNGEELLMAKKGLVFLHFIWSKNLTKFLNGNLYLLSEEEGGEGYISIQILLKNSKVSCSWSLSLSPLLHAETIGWI